MAWALYPSLADVRAAVRACGKWEGYRSFRTFLLKNFLLLTWGAEVRVYTCRRGGTL